MDELTLKTRDGLTLRGVSWAPDGEVRGAVCLVHGHGEHVRRYGHVAAALNRAGYALMGFDLRGHGRSDGVRGHTPSYDHLMDDIEDMLGAVSARFAGAPLFLYGHSMGGNLVLNYGLRRKPDVRGVIATGPWLRLAFEPPAVQVTLGRLMNRIYPGFVQSSGLETAALSRNPDVVRAYETDPLVHDKVSARLFVSMYEAGLWALEHAGEWSLPLLLMHGTADRLTSAEASAEFARRAGSAVRLKLWDGWYHEVHNEPEWDAFWQVFSGFLAELV
jgi:alpha-beta hydrolase superfamily lysophospholipase